MDQPPPEGRPLIRRSTIGFAGLAAVGLWQAASAAVIPAKAVVAQILLDRAFDRSLAAHRPVKPWSWADMAPVARLSIPRIGVEAVALDSGSGEALAFGPTLLPGTALPGDKGTTVIAAHRDTHFENLGKVRKGDIVLVEGIDGRSTRYRVEGTEVTRWDRFAVRADHSTAGLALVTCYPFGGTTRGPYRFVVHAVKFG